MKQYKNLLAQQQKEFQKQRVIITEQGKELEKLKERLDSLLNQVADNNKQSSTNRISNQPLKTAEKNQPSRLPNQELPSKPVGQAPPVSKEKPRPPEIPRLSDTVGGVLTRQGKIVVEPTLQYGYTSNNRVFLDAFTFLPALAVGLIDLRELIGTFYGYSGRPLWVN